MLMLGLPVRSVFFQKKWMEYHFFNGVIGHVLITTMLLYGLSTARLPAWADVPAPGTVLKNQATGSFVNPINNLQETRISSPVVVTTDSDSCTIGQGSHDSRITLHISDEVRRNVVDTRNLVDTLDDSWRTAVGQPADPELESWFGTASVPQGSISSFNYHDPIANNTVNVSAELVQIPTDSTECIGESTTVGSSPTLSSSSSLQGSAPRPASLYNSNDQPRFWNETRAGALSDLKRNAVLLSFDQPISAFGFWVGDLETRTDGHGTPAILRLLDTSGSPIGSDIEIVPTSLYDGNDPDPELVDQSLCGGTTNNELGCGNQSTRWIGFVDNSAIARVQKVMLIVGDDDSAPGNNNADSEHLSFIGANSVLTVSAPQVLLAKRITAINGNRIANPNDNTRLNREINDNIVDSADDHSHWPEDYLLGEINAGLVQPGDRIEYTIYFMNAGGNAAADVYICDWIQPNQSFVTGIYSSNDIILQLGDEEGSTIYTLTAASDLTDRAQLTTVENLPTGAVCNLPAAASDPDAVLVLKLTGTPIGLDTLPGTVGQGRPDNGFGFFRFTTQVGP